ncbi:MAG: hypothetical protein OHK0053_31660 [Microscillaceae bacterium]
MLYIVIPVFNRKKFTQACLDLLRQQTYSDFKVVVVDDGSTDGTDEMLAHDYPEVIVLKGDGNYFWTKATNAGVSYALEQGATYVMTMNNDTIPPENYLEKMMHWAAQKPNAVLGSLEVDYTSKKPVFGGVRQRWTPFKTAEPILPKIPEAKRHGLHPVTQHPGRGCLIPRAVFEKIGLFDEVYFPHYYADFEFTHRAYRSGFESYCNYDAIIYTYPDESGDKQNRKKKNWKKYYDHLFGIRGGGNLRNFTKFTLRYCPPYWVPTHLLEGYTRRLLGYWLK